MADASAAVVKKIAQIMQVKAFPHVPADTNANVVTDGTKKYGIRAEKLQGLRVIVVATSVTTGFTKLEICSADDLSKTNEQVIKTKTLTLDVVGEQQSEEINGDEVHAAMVLAGVDHEWVYAKLTAGSANDRATVVFVEYPVMFGGTTTGFAMTTPQYNTNYQ